MNVLVFRKTQYKGKKSTYYMGEIHTLIDKSKADYILISYKIHDYF